MNNRLFYININGNPWGGGGGVRGEGAGVVGRCKKAKWLSEEALQIAVKRREVKSKGEKERYSI